MIYIYILLMSFIITSAGLQAIESKYEINSKSVLNHIEILADDSLEGRQVSEPGELKAAEYIRSVFKSAGLLSQNVEDYFQYYDFIKEIKVTDKSNLTVNGTTFELQKDFKLLKQSASSDFAFSELVDVNYGIKTGDDSASYNDYADKNVEGKLVLIKRYAPDEKDNPHVDFDKFSSLTDKISRAIKEKAGGIIFYTPEGHDDTLIDYGVTNIHAKEIPIFFFKKSGMKKLQTLKNPYKISGRTELVTVRDTAQNVIGFIQGETDTAVIIGAHYDHLGWGSSSSLHIGEKAIHNGADDNASGVAALLELARKYAQAKEKLHYSMIFIAFSGEEAGLLGANKYAKNMTIDSSKVRMMFNMDMIGRLKEQDNGLAILGVGTTEEFKNYFDSLDYKDIKLSLKESGTGPSDHTIFYNRKIPVLHFFTGAHKDYHKPSDDVEKIDADGIVKVTTLIDMLITHFDRYDKPLVFSKTKDSSEGKRSKRYSVSLGVMPDYVAEVQGLKVDGVMEGRPAEKAGILEGDIVVQLGHVVINDIYDYMDALSKFKKGDTIKALVNRNGKKIELSVTF